MDYMKQALGLVLKSKVLTFTSVAFLVVGVLVGILYLPNEWDLWVRIVLGFVGGLMSTLYAVGNHVLMEMDDSIHDVVRERDAQETELSAEAAEPLQGDPEQ
jgi:hypothetical protein